MSLLFGNAFEFGEHLFEVGGCGIWYFILEVEVDAVCGRDGDGVLALVLLDELPEGVGAELFLEAEGHDFVLLHLRPLHSVCLDRLLLYER